MATSAFLLARKGNWLDRTCIMSMRNATYAATQGSLEWSFCLFSILWRMYFVMRNSEIIIWFVSFLILAFIFRCDSKCSGFHQTNCNTTLYFEGELIMFLELPDGFCAMRFPWDIQLQCVWFSSSVTGVTINTASLWPCFQWAFYIPRLNSRTRSEARWPKLKDL